MNTTKKQKKTPVLKRLLPYAGKKGYMLPLAMLFFSPLGYYGTDAYGIYP